MLCNERAKTAELELKVSNCENMLNKFLKIFSKVSEKNLNFDE